MDRRERIDSLQDSLLAMLQGWQAELWTALPGVIKSTANLASEQTVDVQPAMTFQFMNADGTWRTEQPPLCIHCPVQFPSGGGGTLTFPVAVGDECLLVFASRCIDAWWDQGAIAQPSEYRMHNISDGFALLGFRSRPRAVTGLSTTEVQLRSDDGNTLLGLDPAAGKLRLKATEIDILGNVLVTGDMGVTGTMSNNGTNIGSTHTHGNVQNGPNRTGGPG